MELVLQGVLDLILEVLRDVIAVCDVPDARERDCLAELSAEAGKPARQNQATLELTSRDN